MSHTMLPLERESHERNRKFQPVRETIGFRFNAPTRAYLEYDGHSLAFKEFDSKTGELVGYGVIERGEKVDPDRQEAA